jgi:hypothetical protein
MLFAQGLEENCLAAHNFKVIYKQSIFNGVCLYAGRILSVVDYLFF